MEDQPRVLQQRIEVTAILGSRQQAVKRVGREQDEQQQASRHQAQHTDDTGHHGVVQRAGKLSHCNRPTGQHQHPQQQRTFVPTPHRAKTEQRGQLGVGVRRHVLHREVVGVKTPGQRRKRRGHQQKEHLGGGSREQRPLAPSIVGPGKRQRALDHGHAKGQYEGKLPEFGGHGVVLPLLFCALSKASLASGGM